MAFQSVYMYIEASGVVNRLEFISILSLITWHLSFIAIVIVKMMPMFVPQHPRDGPADHKMYDTTLYI